MPFRVGLTNVNISSLPIEIPGCILWVKSDTGVTKTNNGTLATIDIVNGGLSYVAYDLVPVLGGNNDATCYVDEVGDGGSITRLLIFEGGSGYSTGVADLGSGIGGGSGAKINITQLGGKVSLWKDQSRELNDLEGVGTSYDALPIWVPNQVNGYPCVSIDGSFLDQALYPPSKFATYFSSTPGQLITPLDMFIVMKFDPLGFGGCDPIFVINGSGGPSCYRRLNVWTSSLDYCQNDDVGTGYVDWTTSAFTATDWCIVELFDPGSVSIAEGYPPAIQGMMDGVPFTGIATDSSETFTGETYSDVVDTTSFVADSYIAEIIMYNKAVSSNNRLKITNYLKTKYNLEPPV